MDKDLSRDVGKMQNGIRGFYRSKRFKTRVIALVLALVIIIGLTGSILYIQSKTWSDITYILPCTQAAYSNNFYKAAYISRIIQTKNISQKDFEKMANLKILPRKTITQEQIDKAGIAKYLPSVEELRDMSLGTLIIIMVDKKGNLTFYDKGSYFNVCNSYGYTLIDRGF